MPIRFLDSLPDDGPHYVDANGPIRIETHLGTINNSWNWRPFLNVNIEPWRGPFGTEADAIKSARSALLEAE